MFFKDVSGKGAAWLVGGAVGLMQTRSRAMPFVEQWWQNSRFRELSKERICKLTCRFCNVWMDTLSFIQAIWEWRKVCVRAKKLVRNPHTQGGTWRRGTPQKKLPTRRWKKVNA